MAHTKTASSSHPQPGRASVLFHYLRGWTVPLLVLALLNLGLYSLLTPATTGPVVVPAPQPDAPPVTTSVPTPAPAAPEPAAPVLAAVPAALPAAGRTLLPAAGVLQSGDWQVLAGDWQTEDSSLVQRDTSSYDRIISYRPVFEDYRLRATFRHLTGVGGGVVFHMPQPERRNGAHMVRYADDGAAIFWGYFNADGDFVGQGSAQVPAPGTAAHTLEIVSGADTYAISLDGALLAQAIPLITQRGSVGMVSSRSAVVFETMTLLPLATDALPDIAEVPQPEVVQQPAAAGLGNLSFLSGQWVREGTSVRQLDQTATDFVSATGIAAERYTLRTTILLPADPAVPDVGAGVLFHMPTQDRNNGAQMVRFGSGGREIFWGAFDETGIFQGQGQADLEHEPGTPHTLTLIVSADTYTIRVGEQEIAASVPLQNDGGWIGLRSFRGPVSFQAIQVTLGSERNED
jgi:hypothetical protein